ncbi:MAG: hypothetical protein ACLFPV_03570 [Spirochaetaceae bacterium]
MNWRISLLPLLLVWVFSCRTPEEPPPPPLAPETPPARVQEPEPVEEPPPIERLRVGMTKIEVLELLPDPEEIEITSPAYEVWSYTDHQLHFKDGLLYDWFYIENGAT